MWLSERDCVIAFQLSQSEHQAFVEIVSLHSKCTHCGPWKKNSFGCLWTRKKARSPNGGITPWFDSAANGNDAFRMMNQYEAKPPQLDEIDNLQYLKVLHNYCQHRKTARKKDDCRLFTWLACASKNQLRRLCSGVLTQVEKRACTRCVTLWVQIRYRWSAVQCSALTCS